LLHRQQGTVSSAVYHLDSQRHVRLHELPQDVSTEQFSSILGLVLCYLKCTPSCNFVQLQAKSPSRLYLPTRPSALIPMFVGPMQAQHSIPSLSYNKLAVMLTLSAARPVTMHDANLFWFLDQIQVAQVCAVFKLPLNLRTAVPGLHAYVEWYTDPACSAQTAHMGMLSVPRSLAGGARCSQQRASIIPISDILRSCHLLPVFPTKTCSPSWTSSSVLDLASRFFISNYIGKVAQT
jgi:hypothetical protein